MSRTLLEEKVDNLLEELKACIETKALSENDMHTINAEIDRILYECLYYKSKLVC
ncbi:MAG: hypothetical protein N3B21_09860 [Clostridia bacterium]|nr:hypothetical protein [Clostridia bacterium]